MKRLLLLLVSTGLILVVGCRKQISATEVDMTNYGWELYDQGNYSESNTWFMNAVETDSAYKDGYNGLGWTFGKLMELDSSINYFAKGLPFTQDPNILADTKREIWAGLCFANNALGDDSSAVIWGDSLIAEIANLTPPTWSFSRDTTLNYLDVHLALAMSEFAIGHFGPSLSHVQFIVTDLNSSATFTADTLTVLGRRSIADEIETLRDILATP